MQSDPLGISQDLTPAVLHGSFCLTPTYSEHLLGSTQYYHHGTGDVALAPAWSAPSHCQRWFDIVDETAMSMDRETTTNLVVNLPRRSLGAGNSFQVLHRLMGKIFVLCYPRALEMGQQWAGLSSCTSIQQLFLFLLLALSWKRDSEPWYKASPCCALIWSSWCGVSKAISNIFVLLTQNWTWAGNIQLTNPRELHPRSITCMYMHSQQLNPGWAIFPGCVSSPSRLSYTQFWITEMQINSNLFFSTWPVQNHLSSVSNSQCIILRAVIDSAHFIVKMWSMKLTNILLLLLKPIKINTGTEKYFSSS